MSTDGKKRGAVSPMTISQRTDPMAMHGMVTSPHYLASQAGLDILRRGGNAVEAAIATAAVLTVVYPQMCTLGGDNFWLIYDAGSGTVRGLNASGRAGEKATIGFYRSKGLTKIPSRGWLAANTVPGVVSGWGSAFAYSRDHMDGTLSWKDLLTSALELAVDGVPVPSSLHRWSVINTDTGDREARCLQRFQAFSENFLRDGKPYSTGDVFRQPRLAATLKALQENGPDEFYRGSIAARICADMKAHGGLLTAADFASHTADWVEPITVSYRGRTAYNLPPNTQGMASLEILNILENFDVAALGEGTADYYHLLVEATKEAFADRDRWLTDPVFLDIPLKFLLSREHGRHQAARISMEKAADHVQPMDPAGDTIWLGVVDRKGCAVSLIQSIYHDFGSAIVPGDTGIILQNRGSFFSLDPGNVNCLKPGKRTFHTLNPAMLLRDGRPELVYGTMGGEGQPQTQAALVTRMIDFGMTPQEAIDAPRWLYGRTWGAEFNALRLEGRIPDAVVCGLARRGHPVMKVEDYTDVMGHAGAILVNQKTGVLQGSSDPRGDGLACGY